MRGLVVTGVQTCALPIFNGGSQPANGADSLNGATAPNGSPHVATAPNGSPAASPAGSHSLEFLAARAAVAGAPTDRSVNFGQCKIGSASCRERV